MMSCIIALTASLALASCGSTGSEAGKNEALAGPTSDPSGIDKDDVGVNWPSYGRTYGEGHFSPLDQINEGNVGQLGLDASFDLGDAAGGGTTPLAVDGVVYATVGLSVVSAIDVRTKKLLWTHDPQVGEKAGRKLRYAFGARGIAYWDRKIYVGTQDGRLIALDAKTGNEVWSAQTTMPDDDRFITGAPRVFRGMVIIGHGGADFAPTRGYVTAYDAANGAQKWRFYTVPGDPRNGFENKAMEMAAKTWTGEWWKLGGGGTVWNAITYDPEQNLVYLGVGNGAPHNQKIRSPGGGDNLFLASIVALDANTGEYRWHYQVNPGETWDYNAAMDITLATVKVAGKPRKVLLHAPKNGFFYVIDRTNGKLVSAGKFADKITWATGIDMKTGRPIETPEARYTKGPFLGWPGSAGAHSLQAMAYNPDNGLVYIPTIEMPTLFDDTKIDKKNWAYVQGRLDDSTGKPGPGPVPADAGSSYIQAYDPLAQKRVWKVPLKGAWPGGVLATRGNLVFMGQADGIFTAYQAKTGKVAWKYDARMGQSGAPISFSVDGRQYVALLAGWGGSGAGYMGPLAPFGYQSRIKHHHLLLFALGGKAPAPEQTTPSQVKPLQVAGFKVDPVKAERGSGIYGLTCASCHGFGAIAAGYAPDLRASPVPADSASFKSVLHDGLLVSRGMPAYPELSEPDLEDLRHYIRSRADAE